MYAWHIVVDVLVFSMHRHVKVCIVVEEKKEKKLEVMLRRLKGE